MKAKKRSLSRITIDIPEEDHKRFKAMAAVQGKSMREIVVEAIQEHLKTTRPSKNNEE